jgi:hypothetical protein
MAMKPMNSKQLNQVLDMLAKIGQKHVKKSESLLSSINIKDEMIKIAAKHIVLDPIERKLRTGYLFPISKEKEYTFKKSEQFTALPPTAEEIKKEKKVRAPGSAMSKYPSGSETNTPYVGEQHGGDQVPAASTLAKMSARTIGPKWIREVKRLVDDATKQGMTGIAEITNYVHEQLPEEVYNIWESSHSEIERIVNDYVMSDHDDKFFSQSNSRHGLTKISASKALKDVIQELKQEDRVFADVSDVVMRLNQKGQQTSVNIDDLCKTLADNGITLIKKASDDIIPGGLAEGKPDTDFDTNALMEGTAVEMEHSGNPEQAKEIAKDHLIEDPEYYKKLKQIEGKCGHTPFKSKRQRRFMHWKEPEIAEKWEKKTPEDVKLPETKASLNTEAAQMATPELIEQFVVQYFSAYAMQHLIDEIQYSNEDVQNIVENIVDAGYEVDSDDVIKFIQSHPAFEQPIIEAGMLSSKQAGFNIESASIEQIKDRLQSARESRSYNIERLQEKGLSDLEKDRYEKAKRKWEKDIDRLDRELSRAMKKERKEEREEAMKEKAEQSQEQPAVSVEARSKQGGLDKEAVWSRAMELAKAFVAGNSEAVRAEVLANQELYSNVLAILQERYPMESREFAKMIPNPFPKPESVMAPRPESELKRTREEWQQKSKGQPQEGGDVGVEASANETLTVYAAEPMTEPTFELEKFMSPAEYQELQKMLDMRERTWSEIAKREERNIQEGLPAYSNIDYSEVEVINQKIQQYQDVAKGRKGGETLPETPEVGKPATPGMPELPEEPTIPMPEEGAGVLEKRPLPEFASRKKVMDKQAVTSVDFPHVCKNCKALVVPAGYNELAFLDHKVKPFCTVSDGDLRIGFRYAFARECRGYDPIMKEMVQKSNPDKTETIFEELKERGEQPILKKNASLNKEATSVEGYVCPNCGSEKSRYLDCEDCREKGIPCDEIVCTECGATAQPKKEGKQSGVKKTAEYDDKPMSKPVPIDTKEEADERGKKICPKCFEQGYFQPRGEVHPVHDWHSLWQIDFNSVAHNKDGVCLPKSMAYQSEMAGGPNQFDTERNRIVKDKSEKSAQCNKHGINKVASAICQDCGQDMQKVKTCTKKTVTIKGEEYPRDTKYYDVNKTCHDCGITNGHGNIHHLGCDIERCPVCRGQLISCGHLEEEVE